MSLSTIERLSPFSSSFTWDDYTNELYRFSDDYGYLSVEQMKNEIERFRMFSFTDKINFTMTVEDFVDFLFDANSNHT
jgi:hypothetical protein